MGSIQNGSGMFWTGKSYVQLTASAKGARKKSASPTTNKNYPPPDTATRPQPPTPAWGQLTSSHCTRLLSDVLLWLFKLPGCLEDDFLYFQSYL